MGRSTLVIVQVGAVKIYVAAVEAPRNKETQDETHFHTKIGGKTSLGSSYFALQNFRSHLHVWCPIMPRLAILGP
jgi:hypothetical protein